MLDLADTLRLLHPALAVVIVYPLIGMVVRLALQTRQRRLEIKSGEKSKVPTSVGPDHVVLGRWLAGAVVGLALLGLAHPILSKMLKAQIWLQPNGSVRLFFALTLIGLTAASMIFLLRSRPPIWRVIFAILTSVGLIILGCQPEVFRRGFEIWLSHYYFGLIAAHLMIIAAAILPEIYRSLLWRRIHIGLSAIALFFFISQGFTGTRDLLEIPLGWQEPYVFSCDSATRTCPQAPPKTP